MVCIKILKSMLRFLDRNKCTIGLVFSIFLYTTDAFAVFESAKGAMEQIYAGLRKVIFPAATIGIACVCIAGMFGSFNWKWFAAILLGVFIIAFTTGTDNGVAGLAGLD